MSNGNQFSIKKATTTTDFENGKQLFLQYIKSLHFELSFQDVDRELEEIHLEYNAPAGVLLLAYDGEKAIACAGVRKIDNTISELKRMFVDPAYRGHQLGKRLLQLSLDEARLLGYKAIRLDTVPEMQSAIKLYTAAGFYPIEPYRFNPMPGAIFMEKELNAER
jgi:GNAT superfamily N-acetyltransferase